MERLFALILIALMAGCNAFVPAVGHEGERCSTKDTCRDDLVCKKGICVNQNEPDGDKDKDSDSDSEVDTTENNDQDIEAETENGDTADLDSDTTESDTTDLDTNDNDTSEPDLDTTDTDTTDHDTTDVPTCDEGPCCKSGVKVIAGQPCASDQDALACTDDICDTAGACTHPVKSDQCLIKNTCYANHATNPEKFCQWCSAIDDQSDWTSKPTSATCNDGLDCTYDDHCDGLGACTGSALSCTNDPAPCGVVRTCQGTSSCKRTYPTSSVSCNDNAACTKNDVCNGAGGCNGTSYSCMTPGVCEKAAGTTCNGDGTCTYPANTGGTCDDGNACTYGDTCGSDKSCTGTAYSCNGHGTCNGLGGCVCTAAYTGTYCTQCASGTSGTYPNCGTAGFVRIAAGTFTMGSPSSELGRQSNETQHSVTLTYSFEMKATEVTQGEFNTLMGYNPSYFPACGTTCPVEQVTWHEALAYANALSVQNGYVQCFDCTGTAPDFTCTLNTTYAIPQDCHGYRLPTEAEWEYAARAGTTTAFYNGGITHKDCTLDSNLNAIGWYCGNSGVSYAGCVDNSSSGGPSCAGPHPVGLKTPNAWSLYDMSGNVEEWGWDWINGLADYGLGSVTDPTGQSTGSARSFRGGYSGGLALLARSALRYSGAPGLRGSHVGFRLVRSLP